MPVLRRRRPRLVRRRQGRGFMDALRSAHDWIRKNKIISTVSGALSGVPGIGGIASAINKGSLALGYGKRKTYRRKRVVRRRGGALNLRSILSGAHSFIKKNQLASKLLGHIGHPKLAGLAAHAGYGARKRTVRRRRVCGGAVRRRAPVRRMIRHRGGANFFSTEMLAAPKFN